MSAHRTEHKSLHEVVEQAVVEAPEVKVRVRVKNWFRDEGGALYGPSDDPDKVVELPESYARRLGPVYVEPVE